MKRESCRIEYKSKLTDGLEKEVVAFLNHREGEMSTIKNLDDFFSGYSNPISREIMRIYKDLKLVEHLGLGLNRILKVYSKDSFYIKQNFMRNIFYKNLEPIENNEGVKSLYELIENNPNRKTPFFAKKLNTSVKNIERWIKQLRDKDKIEFIGAPKTGGYVAKGSDDK